MSTTYVFLPAVVEDSESGNVDMVRPLRDIELEKLVCPFDGCVCRRLGVCRHDDAEGVAWEVCGRHPLLSRRQGVFVGGGL